MATVPSGTRFIGIATSVDLTERKSAVLNKTTEPFTIEDIASTVGAGAQGPQGVQGPAGPLGPVGPAGLNWQGAWTSGTSYVADDAVGYDGASWFCILATSGTTTPDLDTTHWALLASQGAQGPQGVQGPTGEQGPAGTQPTKTNGIMYLAPSDSPYQTLAYDINRINLSSGSSAVRLPASIPIGKEISVFLEVGSNNLTIFGDNVLNLSFPFLMGSANQQTGTFVINNSESYVFISLGNGLWKVNSISKTIMPNSSVIVGTTKTTLNGTSVSIIDTNTLLGNVLYKDSLRFNRDNGSGSTKYINLLSPTTITDNRNITLPDASGTLALVSVDTTENLASTTGSAPFPYSDSDFVKFTSGLAYALPVATLGDVKYVLTTSSATLWASPNPGVDGANNNFIDSNGNGNSYISLLPNKSYRFTYIGRHGSTYGYWTTEIMNP